MLTFDSTLAAMLADSATKEELRKASYATGRVGMREDALREILAGVITPEDAERTLSDVPCIAPRL